MTPFFPRRRSSIIIITISIIIKDGDEEGLYELKKASPQRWASGADGSSVSSWWQAVGSSVPSFLKLEYKKLKT
jgi:hypothetical protein